nr:GspH/FimT family pseudopilin [uncultured Desulfuromonas sp.]
MPQPDQRGFTILELVVVIAIIAVAAAVALPKLMDIGKSNQVKSATRQIKDQLALARGEAIRQNNPVVVAFDSKKITVDGKDIPLEIDNLTAKHKTGVDADDNDVYAELTSFQWDGRGYPSTVGGSFGDLNKVNITITGKDSTVFSIFISPSGGIDISKED